MTVTGQSPLVEATSSRIGTNVTSTEIDGLPSANRSQFSLMQTIPGLVPVLQVGSFEGGQFSANGQATTNNLFLVDGQNDNDSRRGGSQGTQARVSLDSMAEYQVQTHTTPPSTAARPASSSTASRRAAPTSFPAACSSTTRATSCRRPTTS